FMALRQEDRHAITEILSQTPEIPENCQWALFLRNHDELTLEMVTDEERDYMYSVYAADPQMRINVGIRRRLAPLVENSRRRTELLNSMLFSMPGTPILYYGDEIGMGDNIYLGDRNGVRTPMQWSSDRNAGFSRSDPARLYAPPIQDPVYGYQAINVEAQERYPFSQLNWTKRLIAMRKQHRVFGRGSLAFVSCPNRKILAYLRRDEKETILIVVNLSRTVQPVELDLRAFAGMIPVEMAGLTEFPRIGEAPYFLSLGPYASYWFALQHETMQVQPKVSAPADENAAILDALPSLLMGVEWQTMLDAATRGILERQALVPFLQRQRWFASKSRTIRTVRVSDWATLRAGNTPAFLAVVSVDYTDGWIESYFVPLALVDGDAAAQALKSSPASVVARITGARKGAIVDGMLDDETCDRLLAMVEQREEIASRKGAVLGTAVAAPASHGAEPEQPAPETPSPPASPHKWARAASDQSNSVAFVDDRFVLKLFRRIEPATNPEFEIGRFLTAHGYSRIPPLAGALEYLRPGIEAATLSVVQGLVKHQGSGWEFSIDELRRYYERVSARVKRSDWRDGRTGPDAPDAQEGQDVALPAQPASTAARVPPPFFAALENWYLGTAATLGRRTGELHLVLGSATTDPDPAFAREPLDGAALDALADDMRTHAGASLDLLAQRLATLADAARPLAEQILDSRAALVHRFDALRAVRDAGARIRVHGDYHLGQVLRTEEDFVILDFEGEPARSIAERRARQSPLKDVAGMLRSFGYAAYAALLAFAVHAPEEYAALEPWADTWEYWVGDAFVSGYTAAVGDSPILPRAADDRQTLLAAFTLDKALYELAYELNNRPDWVRIPLAGIRKLVDGLHSSS
ncbi:MAG TPA: putative maltokinase, partial [Vicinamibacterales bacterium]|nr:putative maltokinase [Vicinamibacterales bacterium]